MPVYKVKRILMYCGNNRIAICSQGQISDALLRLMEIKNFSEISVSAVCREAGVSRQTFYSLFQSKENVVTYTFREKYCYEPDHTEKKAQCEQKQNENADKNAFSLSAMCREYSSYIKKQTKFLGLMVDNDLTYLMQDSLREVMLECEFYHPELSREMRELTADFIAGGLTCIAKNYILQGAKADEEELYRITASLFDGEFFQ